MKDEIFNRQENNRVGCPYFKEGIKQNLCLAYRYGLMVPSIGQEDMFCNVSSYVACPTYLLKMEEAKEVVDVEITDDEKWLSIVYFKDGDFSERYQFIKI